MKKILTIFSVVASCFSGCNSTSNTPVFYGELSIQGELPQKM